MGEPAGAAPLTGRTSRYPRTALGLVLGCHPLPTLAVTAFATGYAAVLGAGPGLLVRLASAVLAGQLCVGWSNDAFDATRDELAARPDKPTATGLISARALAVGAVLAACACVVLSLWLGVPVGVAHLVAVASALAYNGGLKGTWLSPLPYVVSFALLPVVVGLAVGTVRDDGDLPWPQIAAAGLLAAAAHFGNTVGDARADELTGVRGVPQRLGPDRALVVMAAGVAAAAAVLLGAVLVADGADLGAVRRAGAGGLLLAGVLLASTGAILRTGVPGGRAAWRLTLVAVSLVVAGFLVAA